MSVSAVGGAATWFTTTATARASSTAATPTPAQRFLPNDPLNKFLTDGDRAAIKSATAVDVRSDGGILSPVSMSAPDYAAVMDTVGKLAAGRAEGNSSSVTSADLVQMLKDAGYKAPVSGPQSTDVRIDFRA